MLALIRKQLRVPICVGVLGLAGLAGCKGDSTPRPPEGEPHVAGMTFGDERLAKVQQPPFVYNIGGGGSIRIFDVEQQRDVVARRNVPPGSVVVVDPQAGITVGPYKVLSGPLPPKRQYELWVGPSK